MSVWTAFHVGIGIDILSILPLWRTNSTLNPFPYFLRPLRSYVYLHHISGSLNRISTSFLTHLSSFQTRRAILIPHPSQRTVWRRVLQKMPVGQMGMTVTVRPRETMRKWKKSGWRISPWAQRGRWTKITTHRCR
jgi:hypothetical protein